VQPTQRHHPVLLVGAGVREYHAHSLLQIAATHPVVLIDRAIPAWARPYVEAAVSVNLFDPGKLATAVEKFTASHPISGVVSYDPNSAEPAAELVQKLGLPGNAPAAVAACRDPAWAAVLLEEHGIPAARSRTVHNEDSAVAAARSMRFPVYLKAGTRAPLRADDDDEVRAAHRQFRHSDTAAPFTRAMTVEEFGLDGPAVGVEAVVVSPGEVRIAAVTRTDVRRALSSSPLGQSVDAHDELLNDSAPTQLVTQGDTALGLTVGVVHLEMRLTQRGPRLLKVTPSLADDLIPLLVDRATGVNLARTVAALATGAAPDLSARRERAAAIRFLHPEATGRLGRLKAPSSFADQPWLDRFAWTQHTGKSVLGPPHSRVEDRLAHWVVTEADAAECGVRLSLIGDQVITRFSRTASRPVPKS
jgi:biotin carboxylase